MAAPKTAATPGPTKAPKPGRTRLDEAELAARLGGRLTASHKPIHSTVSRRPWPLAVRYRTPGGRSTRLERYNGKLIEGQARHLALVQGAPVSDMARDFAAPARKGYTLATPTPARKTRRREIDWTPELDPAENEEERS